MRTMYTPPGAKEPAYEIECDRHGSYTIWLSGKVIRRVTALTNYLDRPRWGSKKLETEALEDAKCYLDWLTAPGGARGPAPARGAAYLPTTFSCKTPASGRHEAPA